MFGGISHFNFGELADDEIGAVFDDHQAVDLRRICGGAGQGDAVFDKAIFGVRVTKYPLRVFTLTQNIEQRTQIDPKRTNSGDSIISKLVFSKGQKATHRGSSAFLIEYQEAAILGSTLV